MFVLADAKSLAQFILPDNQITAFEGASPSARQGFCWLSLTGACLRAVNPPAFLIHVRSFGGSNSDHWRDVNAEPSPPDAVAAARTYQGGEANEIGLCLCRSRGTHHPSARG
jgi:hypothetical protein